MIIYVNFGKFNYKLGLPKTKKSRRKKSRRVFKN